MKMSSSKNKRCFDSGYPIKNQRNQKVLESAEKLIAIGAFCIGTNQIDLKTATKKGLQFSMLLIAIHVL